MKLVRITVHGLFGEYDYAVPLLDGLTYIHSRNGMGKSTLMKLASYILNGDLEYVRSTPFDRIDLEFDNGNILIVENYGGDLKVQMSYSQLEEELSANDLARLLSSTYVGPERLYTAIPGSGIADALGTYMSELSADLSAAISDSALPEVPSSGEKVSDAEVDRVFKDTLARIDFIAQVGIIPSYPSGYRFPPSRYEISQFPEEYRSLARSLAVWSDRYYRFAESVIVFRDIVNAVFENKTLSFNPSGYPEIRMDRSGTIVSLDKLSSGEKQILIMFYQLLFRSPCGSFVIIDEPEVSLHVSWQQQLGRFFADIARLRELTLVVTTHAPAVIHDDWDRAVELCNEKV